MLTMSDFAHVTDPLLRAYLLAEPTSHVMAAAAVQVSAEAVRRDRENAAIPLDVLQCRALAVSDATRGLVKGDLRETRHCLRHCWSV